jgi:hypothetical protein
MSFVTISGTMTEAEFDAIALGLVSESFASVDAAYNGSSAEGAFLISMKEE